MSLKRRPGRPPKYPKATYMGFTIPAELKRFLRQLSIETGKSMSELVVEAIKNYYLGSQKTREPLKSLMKNEKLDLFFSEKVKKDGKENMP